MPTLDDIRFFWEANPVGQSDIPAAGTPYDHFRAFDNLRESADVEPYAIACAVHGFADAAGKRVLDLGCGNGYVLSHYARHGAAVDGVDLTDAAVRLARERFALLGLEGTFARIDGATLPFPDETFDLACSMGVLHHVPDPSPLVAELHRVLRPGGQLIVMLYHRGSFRYRVLLPFRRRFGPAPYRGRSLKQVLNMNDGPDNPWAAVYSPDEVRVLLSAFEDHRFRVGKLPARELGLYLPVLGGLCERLLPRRAIGALAARIGWNLYCTARKPD